MSAKPYLRFTFEKLAPEQIHTDHAGRDLDKDEARAFARLLKELSRKDFRSTGLSADDAHLTSEAVAKVWAALANAGVAPR